VTGVDLKMFNNY